MEWFDDDTFWEAFSPFIFSDDRLRSAGEDVERILSLTQVSQPDVLDMCCGTGRHAAAFAARGCRVTGVDRAKFALEQARAHAAAASVDVEFVCADMREFARTGSYDLAVNLFTSFGYFQAEDDDSRVLRNLHQCLRPGGQLVIDVIGKEVLARIFRDTRSAVAQDGTLLFWRTAIERDWTRVTGQWSAIRDGSAQVFRVEHWIYSGRELRWLLLQAGFENVRLFGGLDGAEYGVDATRLVAVARRKAE